MALPRIPKQLLQKCKCSKCDCYLSMAPVLVISNGENICGQCSQLPSYQSETTIRCKLYEEFAALHLFPCNYQSRGCLQYFAFNKTTEHEQICTYRTHSCPFNYFSICNWQGKVTQISEHYRQQHAGCYLTKPYFNIDYDRNYECYMLYTVENIDLLLQVKCITGEKKLWFSIVCLGNTGDESMIEYKIKLKSEFSGNIIEFENRKVLSINYVNMTSKQCLIVDIDSVSYVLQTSRRMVCHWCIAFQKNATKCPNCSISMVPPIYRCHLEHVTCLDCKGHNEKCRVCSKTNVEFTIASELEYDAHAAKYFCRWQNCQKLFNCDEIRDHEQQCKDRIYNCPECEDVIGLYAQVLGHFQNNHSQIPFTATETDTLKFAVKTLFTYVLVHREIFKVSVFKDISATWMVHISYFGPRSFADRFQYEVRDRYNVLYYASKCSDNLYKACKMIYCASNVRCEYYLSVKFNKQPMGNIWIPFDNHTKRLCM